MKGDIEIRLSYASVSIGLAIIGAIVLVAVL